METIFLFGTITANDDEEGKEEKERPPTMSFFFLSSSSHLLLLLSVPKKGRRRSFSCFRCRSRVVTNRLIFFASFREEP